MTNDEIIAALKERAEAFTKEQLTDLAECTAKVYREQFLGEWKEEDLVKGMLDSFLSKALVKLRPDILDRMKREVLRM